MIRQPTKVLEPVDVRRLLKHVNTTRYPIRNRTIVLLSFKAGHRACEIAGLTWPMVLNSNGKPDTVVNVCRQIAKQGHARKSQGGSEGALSRRGQATRWAGYSFGKTTAHDGTQRRKLVCEDIRPTRLRWMLVPHSGRRTFIIRSARLIHQTSGFLRDMQELAGHRALCKRSCRHHCSQRSQPSSKTMQPFTKIGVMRWKARGRARRDTARNPPSQDARRRLHR